MKIIWIDESKYLPSVGNVETGNAYNVPLAIGKSLIAQGSAKSASEVKEIKKSRKGDK